jgi:lambda family phage tail tape measure protein
MGEVNQANDLYGKANQAVDVKAATSNSSAYLADYLTADKTMKSVAGLQKDFADNLAKMLASAPKEVQANTSIFSAYRSIERQRELWAEALQKYGSVAEARKWVAPPGNSQHNMGNAADLRFGNDASRQWFHDNANQFGLSFPLKNESWHIEDADARSKANSEAMTTKTQTLEDQGNAYDQLIAKGKEYIATQGTEQNAVSMTTVAASAYRHEQEMLQEAQQAGITLTTAQREQIAALAQQMANAETNTKSLADAQRDAAEAAQLGKDVVGGALTDIRSALADGKITAKEWGDVFVGVLNKIADKMQDMLVNSLFDSKSGGIGGLFSLFTGGATSFNPVGKVGLFDRGGYTGNGGKYDPAGIVHKGEYVFDADTTRRIGVDNLRRLQGYANGGLVGGMTNIPSARGGGSGSQGLHITVGLQQDGLNLEPVVVGVTRREIGRSVPPMIDAGWKHIKRNDLHPAIDDHIARPRRRG